MSPFVCSIPKSVKEHLKTDSSRSLNRNKHPLKLQSYESVRTLPHNYSSLDPIDTEFWHNSRKLPRMTLHLSCSTPLLLRSTCESHTLHWFSAFVFPIIYCFVVDHVYCQYFWWFLAAWYTSKVSSMLQRCPYSWNDERQCNWNADKRLTYALWSHKYPSHLDHSYPWYCRSNKWKKEVIDPPSKYDRIRGCISFIRDFKASNWPEFISIEY